MTKRQRENYAHLHRALVGNLGVSYADFDDLLRIEKTLHRWSERECNGEVEVDETTGDPQLAFAASPNASAISGTRRRYRIPNRKAGALKRLATIMARYPKLAAYVQGDPRGCALYVYERKRLALQPRDAAMIDSCYSSVGVALCY